MNLLQFLHDGWRATWVNKLVFPLSFLIVLVEAVQQIESTSRFLTCLFLLPSLGLVFLYAAIIWIIFQSTSSKLISGYELYRKIASNFGQLLILIAALGIAYIIINLFFRLLQTVLHIDPATGLGMVLNLLIINPLKDGLSLFAVCGVIIHGLSAFRAVFNGLLIAANNSLQFVAFMMIFSFLAFLVWFVPASPSVDWRAILELRSFSSVISELLIVPIRVPAAFLIATAGRIVVAPFGMGVYTVAYLSFVQKVRYPGIPYDETATRVESSDTGGYV